MIFSFLPPESKICGKYNIIVVGYQYFLLNSLGKTGRFLIKVVKQGHTSNNCYSNKNPPNVPDFYYFIFRFFLPPQRWWLLPAATPVPMAEQLQIRLLSACFHLDCFSKHSSSGLSSSGMLFRTSLSHYFYLQRLGKDKFAPCHHGKSVCAFKIVFEIW